MSYYDLLASCDPMQSHYDMNAALTYLEPHRGGIKTVVEIGCYQGGSLAAWSRALHPYYMIGVTRDEVELVGMPARLIGVSTPPRVDWVFGLSQDADVFAQVKEALGDRLIDFLFIDGGHSFREVQNDFILYSALMSPHGIVGVHDVNRGCEDVYRFWEGYVQQDYRHVLVSDAANAGGLGIGLVLGPAVGTWAEQAGKYDLAP